VSGLSVERKVSALLQKKKEKVKKEKRKKECGCEREKKN
jgi:hypothetical protein